MTPGGEIKTKMSKPEREPHWPLFKDCGISRGEFESMNDEEFSNYLMALTASLKADEIFVDEIPGEEGKIAYVVEELSNKDMASKLGKKCKNLYPVEEQLSKGRDWADKYMKSIEDMPKFSVEAVFNQ